MNLLALELATEACSVAVQTGETVVLRHEIAPRRHAELALTWSDALLAQAGISRNQLNAITVSTGPGAFTGVRLAIAMGQGMALALNKPLIGVSTLAVLAMEATRDRFTGNILTVIDARMGEVYAGRFNWNGTTLLSLTDEAVIAPSLLDLDGVDASWRAVGSGIDAADGELRERLDCELQADALPHADMLLRLAAKGNAVQPEFVEPTYLRNNVALTIAQQQAARDMKR